ncbi:hypothetical protein GVAV_000053 [Gurleya vavrai]
MSYFLSILSSSNEHLFSTYEAESEKEHLSLLLVAYSSTDLLPMVNHEDYYFSIDKQFCWNVSVLFLKCGLVILFVHSHSQTQKYMKDIEKKVVSTIMDPFFQFDEEFKNEISKSYRQFYN